MADRFSNVSGGVRGAAACLILAAAVTSAVEAGARTLDRSDRLASGMLPLANSSGAEERTSIEALEAAKFLRAVWELEEHDVDYFVDDEFFGETDTAANDAAADAFFDALAAAEEAADRRAQERLDEERSAYLYARE